jgi:hypothetical protein
LKRPLPALSPDAYLQRAQNVSAPSKISASQEQQSADGPLINNWRPGASAAGLLPELTHPVFGKVIDELAAGSKPDKESLQVAGELSELAARYYTNEVGGGLARDEVRGQSTELHVRHTQTGASLSGTCNGWFAKGFALGSVSCAHVRVLVACNCLELVALDAAV